MKRKLLPPFLMLLAGSTASIIMYIKDYEIKPMLLILLGVLLIFYLLGLISKRILDSFEVAQIKAALDEGEVIEKEAAEAAEADTAETENPI